MIEEVVRAHAIKSKLGEQAWGQKLQERSMTFLEAEIEPRVQPSSWTGSHNNRPNPIVNIKSNIVLQEGVTDTCENPFTSSGAPRP